VDELDAVQRSALRVPRWGVAALAAALACLAFAAPAGAVVAPDISSSTLVCSDANGGALRGNDDLACSLTAAMAYATENATISATIALPDSLDIDPALPPPVYDSSTRVITLGPTVLGFTFTGDQRVFTFDVRVVDGLDPGTPISLTANMTAVGASDGAVVHAAPSSPALVISPPSATLEDSVAGCSDQNGGQLLPGDLVACDLDVVNGLGVEDAGSVVASLLFSGGTWVSGGLGVGPASAFFATNALGSIPAGTDKTVSAEFKVSSAALGGSTVGVVAFITGHSTPSGDLISLSRGSDPLVVAPGPAQLTASSLRCDDSNGGLLLAGDDLTCTVTVLPAVGFEDVQAATATVDLPAALQWASGGDSHDASTVTFGPPSLGDIAAGGSKSAGFHLRVADGTAPGSGFRPTGSISATSVPVGGPVQQVLIGNLLAVGQVVPAPGQDPTPDQPLTIVTPPPVKPPAVAAPKSYKLRAKTIRFVMRRGHRRGGHLWKGSKRRSAFVKKYVVRTPKASGQVVKRVTVPKKGKWAPKRGKVTVKGTKLTYTLKKGVDPGKVKDRFHYTATDTRGKKVTGTVIVSH
jgi:hypothetical protein